MQLSSTDLSSSACTSPSTSALGWYYRRASASIGEFFVSGGNVPWWLAGTSIGATTFAADTPLLVTALLLRTALPGTGCGGTCPKRISYRLLLRRLWRRAGVLTDTEFAEIRVRGQAGCLPARFSRAVSCAAVNTIIMGWVNLAMAKILV